MPVDLQKFKQLYQRLFEVDFDGAVPGICISLDSAGTIRAATARGAPFLPLPYQQNFHRPLDAMLPDIMSKLNQQVQSGERPAWYRALVLEALYGAVYQHGHRVTEIEARPQLKRFLAVVSNLYRSFIDADNRDAPGIAPATKTPPLALFQSASGTPFTIEQDLMEGKFGLSIGIVSLPAGYRDHPALWCGLAHEVGGHDLIDADSGLADEMIAKTHALLAPDFAPRCQLDTATLNALIWSYWMEETAADVYGVLNMGPSFALNLAGFLAAFRAKRRGQTEAGDPYVSIDTAELGNGDMDVHPIDLLRFHVAIGAVEGLQNLSAARRGDYVAGIEAVAGLVGIGVTEIGLRGRVTVDGDKRIEVNADMKLADAAAAAREVGRMLATEKFAQLDNYTVQDIETWDDADEDIAQEICAKVLAGESIVACGDDAQLLAGVTMALLQKPELYDPATELLNAALDDSFDRDPIWGATLGAHAMVAVGRMAAKAEAKPAKAKAGKAKAAKKPAAKKQAAKKQSGKKR